MPEENSRNAGFGSKIGGFIDSIMGDEGKLNRS